MGNSQHPAANSQRPMTRPPRAGRNWLLAVFLILWRLAPFCLFAQVPLHLPPGALMQLQVQQPPVDVSTPATATAEFDPPVVRAGEKTFYRVNVAAAEATIQWPAQISAPTELQFGANAHGQLTELQGNKFRPLTAFVYEVQATKSGHFTVTNFSVTAAAEPVAIPAASLEVLPPTGSAGEAVGAPRKLALEILETNLFLGQPFHVRVVLPAGPGNEIEALREVQLNGDGLMTDRTSTRQAIETLNLAGQLKPAFVCELTATPIAAGPLQFSAQGFTAGREFFGPISIHGQVRLPGGPPQYNLLISDPLEIHVRPLPVAGELPGFTGSIGKFFFDPPQLATNRLRVGEPVQLKITFHGAGDLARLVPPAAPRSRNWQIIADPPPATSFTLIPQTDEATHTPAIPFSYFDPETAKYVDLTIPPLPVTVVGEGLPVQLPAFTDEGRAAAPLKLSGLAATPGKPVSSLKPLQLRGWFVGVQLAPAIGFLALWQWDRRRRFLAAHPEIVRRRRARRALRREKRRLQKAVAAGDSEDFLRHAVAALRVACAPHYPAHPRALVCADVLEQLGPAGANGRDADMVRRLFAAADAQFAATPQTRGDLLELNPAMETLLQKLEARL